MCISPQRTFASAPPQASAMQPLQTLVGSWPNGKGAVTPEASVFRLKIGPFRVARALARLAGRETTLVRGF
jgi:hypothetical protein